MATEDEVVIDGAVTEVTGDEAPEAVADAVEQSGEPQADDGEAPADEGEVVITIGDEAPPDETTFEDDDAGPIADLTPEARVGFIRLRQAKQRLKRELEEAKQKLAGGQVAAPADDEPVGPEPDMGDEGIDYDKDLFKARWTEWQARKAKAEAKQAERAEAQKREQAAWQKVTAGYETAKKTLRIPDIEDRQAVVEGALSVVQQAIILKGPRDSTISAQLVAAIGANPKKLKELAAITDPVEFAVAIGEAKAMLKVTPKKTAPPPERVVRSGVPGAASIDNTADRLRAEALKTGDMTALMKYNASKRAQQRG